MAGLYIISFFGIFRVWPMRNTASNEIVNANCVTPCKSSLTCQTNQLSVTVSAGDNRLS